MLFITIQCAKTQFTGTANGVLGESAVGIPVSGVRGQFVLRELTRRLLKCLLFLIEGEIHGIALRFPSQPACYRGGLACDIISGEWSYADRFDHRLRTSGSSRSWFRC